MGTDARGAARRIDLGPAEMISPVYGAGMDDPAPRLRTNFTVREGDASGVLDITAWGVFEARVNGKLVDDVVLAPGWTAYESRLLVRTVDVTRHLVVGENSLDVVLGNGWYRGNLGRPARRDLYGDRLGLLARLRLSDRDGEMRVAVSSDTDWKSTATGILANDLYNGSTIDVRAESARERWEAVERLPFDSAILERESAEPVRVLRRVPALSVDTHPGGSGYIVDFGENIVGWVEFSMSETRDGQVVTVRHAEVLEPDGSLALRPLRQAEASDRYILAHAAREHLAPPFTFHGFRYAHIEGAAIEQLSDITAAVVGSDVRRTGWLETSEPLLNSLHENVFRSLQGNFLSLPTDCPQRDERLGWTADIQVFAPTAAFLVDGRRFLASWLADVRAEQKPDGSIPNVVPDIYRRSSVAAAGWGDAITVVPWSMYERYGDPSILAENIEAMRGWVDHVAALAGEDRIWSGGYQYGDWLDPAAPPDDPAEAVTDPDLVATVYFHRSAEILSRASGVLGDRIGRGRYAALADEIRAAFGRRFQTDDGLLTSDTQAGYALALAHGLVRNPRQRAAAGRRLADLVRLADFTVSTGFLGAPVLLDALTGTGQDAVAMRLMMQTRAPSWLYPVTMGATTVWERWDSMLPDGSINPGEMTSFNHYAFGAVADWMHRYLGGLRPLAPGYRRFEVRPPVGTGLSSARVELDLDEGRILVEWREHDDTLRVAVTVPPSTEAVITLPGSSSSVVRGAGTHDFSVRLYSSSATSGAPMTTREAMDDPALWDDIVTAVVRVRPAWNHATVARKARRYLDLDVRSLARIVGLSVELPDEVVVRDAITAVLAARTSTPDHRRSDPSRHDQRSSMFAVSTAPARS